MLLASSLAGPRSNVRERAGAGTPSIDGKEAADLSRGGLCAVTKAIDRWVQAAALGERPRLQN